MQEEIQEIAQKWYTLASGGEVERRDTFFRFIATWIAFNALYASMHSNTEGDRKQVRSFSKKPEAIDRHLELLKVDSKYRESVSILQERGVYDPRRRRPWKISEEYDLSQVAECFYQVRCNLFHADKMPGDPRDEHLVEASYLIVSKLVEPYLNGRQSHWPR